MAEEHLKGLIFIIIAVAFVWYIAVRPEQPKNNDRCTVYKHRGDWQSLYWKLNSKHSK